MVAMKQQANLYSIFQNFYYKYYTFLCCLSISRNVIKRKDTKQLPRLLDRMKTADRHNTSYPLENANIIN